MIRQASRKIAAPATLSRIAPGSRIFAADKLVVQRPVLKVEVRRATEGHELPRRRHAFHERQIIAIRWLHLMEREHRHADRLGS